MIKKWTEKEENKLREIYPNRYWDYILKTFPNTTKKQIRSKAGKLGLLRNIIEQCGGNGKTGTPYSKKDVQFIKRNHNKMTISKMSYFLGRGESSVSNKISELGLRKLPKWTSAEVSILKKVYPFYDNEYIVENYFPDKTVSSVLKKAHKINLQKSNKKINRKKITKKQAIDGLIKLSRKLNRTPIHSELVPNGLPSLSTYRSLFGNYTNACEEAGLVPNFSKIGLGRKSVLKSKNNDICYSIYEQIITNFFIDNRIKYKKEERYSDYISDSECKTKKVDWVLNGGVFVEYWGFPNDKRYKQQMKIKKNLCKNHNIKLIDLYVKDINNLYFIFNRYIS